jgi:GDP-mannose 6-dehydrogenase
MKHISIFGLGYVGCVGIGCFAKLGHSVIGCDVDPRKVALIKSGRPTIVERDVESLIADGFSAGRITATDSAEDAVLRSDISFICVGTPVTENNGLDLQFIETAIENIAKALIQKNTFHIVVIRSTVPPGTNERIGKKLEQISGKKLHSDFAVVSNPEFLREGKAVEDFMNPPLTVIGSDDSDALEIMKSLYAPIKSELVEVLPRVAEMIKFVNNSYHAMKVAFGNEVGAICKPLGIDSHEVMKLFCKDSQLNISPMYFMPGFAYGGSCLPKDLKGLNHLAQSCNVRVPLLSSVDLSNQVHIDRVRKVIQKSGKRKIGLVGLTFKAGTDDLRNSASVVLANSLLNDGYSLKIYDRFLNIAKLQGENIALRLSKEIADLLCRNVHDILEDSELVIIAVKNPELPEMIRQNPKIQFLDLVRIKDESVFSLKNYEGLCW